MTRQAELRTRAFGRQLAKQGFTRQGRAMQTVAPNLAWNSARTVAYNTLTDVDKKAVIMAELNGIATKEEIEGFFSKVMRSDGERTPDRIKAAENAGKIKGMYVERHENVNFDGDKREDMRKQALKEAEQALEALIETDRGGEGQSVMAKDTSGRLT